MKYSDIFQLETRRTIEDLYNNLIEHIFQMKV